jgi:hypothetical protein
MPQKFKSLDGICVAFNRISVTVRPEREEETMRKGISFGTAIILAGFLGITLPGCSEDRNTGTGGDAAKGSGGATGSKSSPGGGSSSSGTGTGGSATGSGSSGSAGSGSGGSGS